MTPAEYERKAKLMKEKQLAQQLNNMGSLRSRDTRSVNLGTGGLQAADEAVIVAKLDAAEAEAEAAAQEEESSADNEIEGVHVSDSLPSSFSTAREMFERRATLKPKPIMPLNKYSYSGRTSVTRGPNEPNPRLVKEESEKLLEIEKEAIEKELKIDGEADKELESLEKKAPQVVKNVKNKTEKTKEVQEPKKVKPNYTIRKKKEEWELVQKEFKETFWANYTEVEGKFFNGFAIQGWRNGMEDVMDAFYTRNADLHQLFGVYDGHGGDDCAKYCKQTLLRRLALHNELHKNPKKALVDSFVSVDKKYCEKAKQTGSTAGTTASVLYVTPVTTEEKKRAYKYYLACVGDSRAILVYNSNKVVPLSNDHNLKQKAEMERIKAGNGEIWYDNEFDEILVYCEEIGRGLNVTRTIGDKDFKPLVTAYPEISDGYLDENCGYICIASDGLWGKVSNMEAGKILLEYGTVQGVKNLANLANARGSFDNVTIMAIDVQEYIKEMKKVYK